MTGLPAWVQARLDAPGAALLDVGCGGGKFLARILAEHPGCRAEGLDFSLQAAEVARTLGCPAHIGTLEELSRAGALPGPYDVITMWWYLEHVHDPATVLALCRDLLKPGGVLCCGVPNARAISGAAFGADWYSLDPPRHLWIFSPRGLAKLAEGAGFSVAQWRHDYSAWGILGSMQYKLQGPRAHGAHWVEHPVLKQLLRPFGMLQGLLGRGDGLTLYAVRR